MKQVPEYHFDVIAQPNEDIPAAAKWAWECLERLASFYCEHKCMGCLRPETVTSGSTEPLQSHLDSQPENQEKVEDTWKRAQKDLHEAIAYLPCLPDAAGYCPACSVVKALKLFPEIAKYSPIPPVVTLKLNTEDCYPDWCYCGGVQERSFPCCNAEVTVGDNPLPSDMFGVGISRLVRYLCA